MDTNAALPCWQVRLSSTMRLLYNPTVREIQNVYHVVQVLEYT